MKQMNDAHHGGWTTKMDWIFHTIRQHALNWSPTHKPSVPSWSIYLSASCSTTNHAASAYQGISVLHYSRCYEQLTADGRFQLFFFKHQHNFCLFKRGSFFSAFSCHFILPFLWSLTMTSHYPLLVLYLQEQVRPHVPVKMCPSRPMLVSLCWVTEEILPLTLLPLQEKHKLDTTSKRTYLPI